MARRRPRERRTDPTAQGASNLAASHLHTRTGMHGGERFVPRRGTSALCLTQRGRGTSHTPKTRLLTFVSSELSFGLSAWLSAIDLENELGWDESEIANHSSHRKPGVAQASQRR
jgi:hypothetical protein